MTVADEVIGRVAEIWRYPVQSMRGERLDAADLTSQGIAGDRVYGLVDPESGEVVSSAQGKRKWRGIVALSARFPGMSFAPVEIQLPDGSCLRSDQEDIDTLLAAALGEPVHLADRTHEGVRSDYGHEPLHLLTTASLRQFAAYHPQGRFESARFRPNLVFDLGNATGFVEQSWIGHRFRIGEGVEIRISEHCVRCVMTTLPQSDLPHDPEILQTVNKRNGTHAGVYAAVATPGRVRAGDPVRALD